MKVAIVEEFVFYIYAGILADNLEGMGIDVVRIKSPNDSKGFSRLKGVIEKFFGYSSFRFLFNVRLVLLCVIYKPDILFIYRCRHIRPFTLKLLQSVKIVYYNNDDFLSHHYKSYYWDNVIKSLPHYDQLLVYRDSNLRVLKSMGYQNVQVFMPYYNEHLLINEKRSQKGRDIDVLFIGHYEDDGRDKSILTLLKSGIDVRLYGTEWTKSIHFEELLTYCNKIVPVGLSEYSRLINRAKISLVFFSKRNNDEYTRRCFELPLGNTVMLSKPSKWMKDFYIEGEEAMYFYDDKDLLSKVRILLDNDDLRSRISNSALLKLNSGRFSSNDRSQELIEIFELL